MITLRPVEADDEAFLREVYGSTRADEIGQVPWSDEEKRAFLDMQFTAQKTDYTARFPESEHSVIVVDGEPVGRVWIDRRQAEIRLIDIALLPEARGAGVGAKLLEDLQREARQVHRPLRHSVYKTNLGALRFYERLGFEVIEDFETHVLMEWTAPPDRPGRVG